LSSSNRRLLNFPDTPRTTQRWQSFGGSGGQALIGQAGKRHTIVVYKHARTHTYTGVSKIWYTLGFPKLTVPTMYT